MKTRSDINLGIQGEPDAWVHSACILCSNGCGLDIAVKDGRIVGVRGAADHPVNFGHLGPKGRYGWVANNSKRRGTTPMPSFASCLSIEMLYIERTCKTHDQAANVRCRNPRQL